MKKILDWLEKIVAVLCMVGLATISILGILQVFFRFVVRHSLSFTEELMIFLFVWIIFLGAAIALRHQAHAVVGMVVDKFTGKTRKVIEILGTLVNIGFLSLVTVKGFQFALDSHKQLSIAMEIPMSFVYLSIPVGSLLMLIYSIEYLYSSFTKKLEWKEQQ